MAATYKTPVPNQEKVGWGAYLSLLCACIFFSGALTSPEWWGVFDFTTLNGSFGKVARAVVSTGETIKTTFTNFRGAGGNGARDGFMFAFTLAPAVMLAIAMVTIFEYYGALKAAAKLLTPIMRPILGLPGITVLSLIATMQSTDAGSAMTRKHEEEKEMTHTEVLRSAAFQMTSGACLVNYFSSGAVLFTLTGADGKSIPLALGFGFLFILITKFIGCIIMRFLTLKDEK